MICYAVRAFIVWARAYDVPTPAHINTTSNNRRVCVGGEGGGGEETDPAIFDFFHA